MEMNCTYKLIATAALCAVVASITHAQAYAYGQSYASATFYASAPGLYFSTTTNYGGPFNGSYGSNWTHFDSYTFTTTSDSGLINTYGYSSSEPQPPPGAWWASGYSVSGDFTVTNMSSNFILATVDMFTYCDAYSSAAGWNDAAYADAYVNFRDTDGGPQLFSEADSGIIGFNAGPDNYGSISTTSFGYYSTINSASGIAVQGYNFPNAAYGYTSDLVQYQWGLAPGAFDRFSFYSYMVHSAYSETPGPVAIAPFAIGLLSFLRRRRKPLDA